MQATGATASDFRNDLLFIVPAYKIPIVHGEVSCYTCRDRKYHFALEAELSSVTNKNGGFSVKAHRGDAKTLLAFNLDKKSTKNLAGFTIQCQPDGQTPFFIQNQLQFKSPGDH